LTEVEPRSDRVVSLEDVKPNAPTHYTFKILNSSDSSFTVTKVKAPCLCLFEKDLVGIQIKTGEVLEVPCVLPVGSKQETALLEIFTNSNAAEFRHVQLKLTATPKLTFFSTPPSLILNSESGMASQELLIHSAELSLTESLPKVFTLGERGTGVVYDVHDPNITPVPFFGTRS